MIGFESFWILIFSAMAVLSVVLVLGLGLRNAGSAKLTRFITAFEKDFPKNSIITDHALVRFEENRFSRAKWEVYNAIRSAVTIGFAFVGLALGPVTADFIDDWDGSLRVMFVLSIVVVIIMVVPEIAEWWFKRYRFDEAKHQKPQWDYMEQVAKRYRVKLDRSKDYKTNLTHLRTSIEALAFRAVQENSGTQGTTT